MSEFDFKKWFEEQTNDQKSEIWKVVQKWNYSRPYWNVADFYKPDMYRVVIECTKEVEAESEEEAIEKAKKIICKSDCKVEEK